jgi:hypothetical protein
VGPTGRDSRQSHGVLGSRPCPASSVPAAGTGNDPRAASGTTWRQPVTERTEAAIPSNPLFPAAHPSGPTCRQGLAPGGLSSVARPYGSQLRLQGSRRVGPSLMPDQRRGENGNRQSRGHDAPAARSVSPPSETGLVVCGPPPTACPLRSCGALHLWARRPCDLSHRCGIISGVT